MRWPDVLLAIATVARDDATLVGIYGDEIRLAGEHANAIPSLDILLVSDAETELWEPIVLQFSQWTTTLDDLIASERRIRELFVHTLAAEIGGVSLFSEYSDGVALDAPNRDNAFGRAARIEFEPLRADLLRP